MSPSACKGGLTRSSSQPAWATRMTRGLVGQPFSSTGKSLVHPALCVYMLHYAMHVLFLCKHTNITELPVAVAVRFSLLAMQRRS